MQARASPPPRPDTGLPQRAEKPVTSEYHNRPQITDHRHLKKRTADPRDAQDAFVRLWGYSRAGLNRTQTWRPWTVDGRRRMGGYVMERGSAFAGRGTSFYGAARQAGASADDDQRIRVRHRVPHTELRPREILRSEWW